MTENAHAGPRSALPLFVGMVYATMLHLVVVHAYDKTAFESAATVMTMVCLLAFFAYDWLNRSVANTLAPISVEPDLWTVLKLSIDLAVVFFLSLASLVLIELIDALLAGNQPQVNEASILLSKRIGFLALASWLWNLIVIGHAKILDASQRRKLFLLTIPADLLEKHFRSLWKLKVESEKQLEELNSRRPRLQNVFLSGEWSKDLAEAAQNVAKTSWSGIKNLPIIVLPCWLVAKFVLLDLVLGITLLLFPVDALLVSLSWILWLTGGCITWTLLYAVVVMRPGKTADAAERVFALSLVALCLGIFLSLPGWARVAVYACQQLAVGQLMLMQFKADAINENDVASTKTALAPAVACALGEAWRSGQFAVNGGFAASGSFNSMTRPEETATALAQPALGQTAEEALRTVNEAAGGT